MSLRLQHLFDDGRRGAWRGELGAASDDISTRLEAGFQQAAVLGGVLTAAAIGAATYLNQRRRGRHARSRR